MKKEVVVLCDGQLDVFEVLEDIEKNGLVPVRERTVTKVPCGCGRCIDCDFGDGRKTVVSERVIEYSKKLNDCGVPKPLWNR